MNKKFCSLFLIVSFILVSAMAFAKSIDFMAEFVFSDSAEVVVTHKPAVSNVSAIDRVLNVFSSVDFDEHVYVDATAELLYYFNGDPNTGGKVYKGKIVK